MKSYHQLELAPAASSFWHSLAAGQGDERDLWKPHCCLVRQLQKPSVSVAREQWIRLTDLTS